MNRCPWCSQELPDTEQPTLSALDAPAAPKARRTDPRTSHDAAKLAFPNQGSQRARLLTAIGRTHGGLTAEEAAQRAGIKYVSASTRCTELVRGGWLVVIGERDGKQVLGLTYAAADKMDEPSWAVAA